MNRRVKISIYWLLMGITMMMHSVLSTVGLFFGKNLVVANATGEVPPRMYVLIIFTMILPCILAFVQLNTEAKWFKYLTLVWSGLLLFLNGSHLYGTVLSEKDGIDQLLLLSFILVVNGFLIKELYGYCKE